MRIAHGCAGKVVPVAELKDMKKDQWAQATIDLGAGGVKGDREDSRGKRRIDEVQFLLPPGGELLLDDVLLFEPGPGSD